MVEYGMVYGGCNAIHMVVLQGPSVVHYDYTLNKYCEYILLHKEAVRV